MQRVVSVEREGLHDVLRFQLNVRDCIMYSGMGAEYPSFLL